MVTGKTTRIAAIALLVLALGLAWRLAPGESSVSEDKRPDAGNHATTEPKPVAEEPPRTQEPEPTLAATDTPPAKLSERKETMSIRDLEKHGIVVEAEHVGKNSASGKVRITVQGGGVLEAERAKMNSMGMLVAEGNPRAVVGESRFEMGSENGVMAIFFDEKKQSVVVRGASPEEITKELDPNDPTITDPDRGSLSK